MQVIGLCRFSYPSLGGFQVEHEGVATREAYLYAPERLEERFRLFETVALPGLAAQTDREFDLVLVIGESLPPQYRDRLHDITAHIPQISIQAFPPGPHREVMQNIYNSARLDLDEPCLQFRFDDDDGVAVDFVERLRSTERACRGLTEQNRFTALDFSKGYNAEFGAFGVRAQETIRPYFTAAMGMHVNAGRKMSILNFSHSKVNRFMPTVTISDVPMWVRSHNGFNDSRQKDVAPMNLPPLTDQLDTEFRSRFAIDENAVRRAFTACQN